MSPTSFCFHLFVPFDQNLLAPFIEKGITVFGALNKILFSIILPGISNFMW